MTLPLRLMAYLKSNPNLSAAQLAHALNAKPAHVNNTLKRLLKFGRISRSPKPGPRGGKTYDLPPTPAPTLWERLRDNNLL